MWRYLAKHGSNNSECTGLRSGAHPVLFRQSGAGSGENTGVWAEEPGNQKNVTVIRSQPGRDTRPASMEESGKESARESSCAKHSETTVGSWSQGDPRLILLLPTDTRCQHTNWLMAVVFCYR